MNFFITGVCGFIGSNLAKKLLQAGHEVRGFDLEGTDESNLSEIQNQITMCYGNVTDPESIRLHLDNVDVVIHLAALLLDWGPADPIMTVNLQGTANVLNAAIDAGVKRFVAMSSLTVHGFDGFQAADESTPYNPYNAYARSKKGVEDLLNAAHQQGKIETVIVRPGFTIFGPNDRLFSFEVYSRIDQGKSFPTVNKGKSLMCYSYVENLADGLILVATTPEAAGQTYIISDGPIIPFKKLLEAMFVSCGRNPKISSFPSWLAFPIASLLELFYKLFRSKKGPLITLYRVNVSSTDLGFVNSKVVSELGYTSTVNLDEALKRTYAWYKEESKRHQIKG